MAEIKSTMEMVLQRAARMGGGAAADAAVDEKIKQGMRLGAAYFRGEETGLLRRIDEAPEQDRKYLQKGVVRTLLRNIFLPRESEQREAAEKATEGLLEIGRSDNELLMIFGDMKKILEQYLAHREQLKHQLESQFAQQIELMEQNITQQTGMEMKLDPAQHPKFQEEWLRLQTELNNEYGRALEQHKQLVERRLTA